jgi:hypothetical protein
MPDNLPAVVSHRTGYLADAERFEFGQRAAKLFADSQLIPAALRGKPSDCFIGLHMAERMNEDPLTVLQNIVIIKGNAGWKAQYMIARANASGIFTGRIKWRVTGSGDSLSVVAYATMADTGEEVQSPAVDMKMAKAEGWTVNVKYQSMPEVMLRYRSAAFLVRFNCPEVMLGMQTGEELEDMRYAGTLEDAGDGTFALPADADPFERAAAGQIASTAQQPAVTASEPTEPAPVARRGRPTNAEKAAREAAEKAAAEAQKAEAEKSDDAPAQTDAKVSIDVVDQHGQVTTYGTEGLAINELRRLINGAEDEDAVIAIRNANGPFLGKHPDLAQTAQNRLNAFVAARQADGEQEAADEDPREADYDDGLPGLAVADPDPTPAVPGIDITLMMEDGKTAKAFSIPAQAAEYEAEFRRVFTAIAERRSVSEYNAAVQPHGKEVNKLKADPAHEALVGRLRAMLGEIGKIVTSPRPAPGGTSEVH